MKIQDISTPDLLAEIADRLVIAEKSIVELEYKVGYYTHHLLLAERDVRRLTKQLEEG